MKAIILYEFADNYKMIILMGVRKNAPGKKAPRKYPPPPPHRKTVFRAIAPRKSVTKFLFLLTLSYGCSFSNLFIVTSFRGVSRTPATCVIDLLVTVVNDINYCHKKLQFRCCRGRRFASEFIRWSFSKIFISKAHSSASDTR